MSTRSSRSRVAAAEDTAPRSRRASSRSSTSSKTQKDYSSTEDSEDESVNVSARTPVARRTSARQANEKAAAQASSSFTTITSSSSSSSSTSSSSSSNTTAPTGPSSNYGVNLAGTSEAPEMSGFARFFRRFWTSLLMFLTFCYLIHLGQTALASLVVIVQFLMYREVVHIAYSALLKDDSHVPLFRTLNWYWFLVTIFFAYGRVLRNVLNFDTPYHLFFSFSLLVVGIVAFVLTLRKGMYRQQFSMFAWVLLALAIVVLQSTTLIYNMFQGLFWFALPAILIISNDSWAYVWGMALGRTPLIQISPKKTWEGFIGAFVSTLVTAFFVSRVMVDFPILICPQNKLTIVHPTCTPDDVFIPVFYNLPFAIFGVTKVLLAPVQLHALVMGLFASVIAPFGGFFASGFKRAFKVKDFGTLIPGHGGLTDRMDCQLLMGLFVYVYYWSFVNPREVGVHTVQTVYDIAMQLNSTSRAELVKLLAMQK